MGLSGPSAGAVLGPHAWACVTIEDPSWPTFYDGSFTSVTGTPRSYLARLQTDGLLDATFAPLVNNELRAIVVQPDGRSVIGGRFTAVVGSPA